MAGKIIGIMFASRDLAHKEHLKTGSYAQHVALGSFYEEVVSMSDKLAETYQGRHGVIKDIPVITLKGGSNIADKLSKMMDMIEADRVTYGNDTPIQNIIDEIVGLYLTTLYKLRTLK